MCQRLQLDCFKTIEYFRFRFWSQNHCLFFFDSFEKKNRKRINIYCISGCLRKGRYSAKLDCLVWNKNVTCFRNQEQLSRVPTKYNQYLLLEQRQHKIEAGFGLSMPKNPWNNSYYDQIIAVLEASGTKLSSPFYCCISRLTKWSLVRKQTRDLAHIKQQVYH